MRLGLSSRTSFFRADLWQHNLAQYDNIVIFGVEQMVSLPAQPVVDQEIFCCTVA